MKHCLWERNKLIPNFSQFEKHVFLSWTLFLFFSWYHGRLDRKQAEERLQSKSAQCSYLVRESTGKSGIYSLSYLSLGKTISHFRITAICGDYYIGGRKFQSLPALIGYYSTYGSLMKDEKLKHPVAPPEPVHLAHRVRATFPYTASPDCDELRFVNQTEMFSETTAE